MKYICPTCGASRWKTKKKKVVYQCRKCGYYRVHFNCETCEDKKCLVTKKPCREAEDVLNKQDVFGRHYLRPKVSADKRHDGKWLELPQSQISAPSSRMKRKIEEMFK